MLSVQALKAAENLGIEGIAIFPGAFADSRSRALPVERGTADRISNL
jgi:hypothetical protein